MGVQELQEGWDQLPQKLNVKTDRIAKKVSIRWRGEIIAESTGVLLLHERGQLPIYYFPAEDVRTDLLTSSDRKTFCPLKGEASYWNLQTGDEISENAVWSYEHPIQGREDIAGYYAFYWHKVDGWYEEEEEIFVHARDPYKRIDVLRSSRHIEIYLNGVKLADSTRPVMLFETGVPVRYYLPEADIHVLLEASDSETACPYKGKASYRSVRIHNELHKDLVWTYTHPIAEIPQIAGLFSFYNEQVELFVDGVRQPKQAWYRSALDFFNESEL